MSARGDWVKTACITVLGSGFAPIAPGSWGSLVAVGLFVPVWLLAAWGWMPRAGVELVTVAGILLASVLAVAWGQWAIARFGKQDPGQFVLDEFAGQWVTLLALPVALDAALLTVAAALAGQFFLFRLCDIIKPPPARQMERLPAGWGILVDDLFAGLYANLLGQLGWWLLRMSG